MSDEQRRRRVWANKSADERLNVAPAFMDADPDRMAIIEKLGDLKGGVTFVKSGAWHETRSLRIAMSNRDTASADYQITMRHEYGHHIDAVIDRRLLSNAGQSASAINVYGGYASRRALTAIAEDGKALNETLTQDAPQLWKAKPQEAAKGALQKVEKAQDKLATELGINSKETAPGAYAKLDAEFKKRGMDFAEAQKIAPALSFAGLFETGPGPDYSTYSRVQNAIKFLVAYDEGDHYTLIQELSSVRRGSALVGLSDSIGASTLQQIGYAFGHPVSYYTKFRSWSEAADRRAGFPGSFTHKLGRRSYGVGTSAQLFANWFEAWTSGNATQYALFTKFFPRTSKIFEDLVEEAMKS
jgi:hypothetical protein